MDPINEASNVSVVSDSETASVSLEDRVLLLLAKLMEGAQEDEDTCKELSKLTKLLSDDLSNKTWSSEPRKPLYQLLDSESVETLLGYLDMRQSSTVRGYAVLTTSAYLQAAEQKGTERLSEFFYTCVAKGTYDDLIVAFSVASSLFPIIPDVIAPLFLSEGFIVSIRPLMKRKWKSRKVEQAALELLNTACMNTACRGAIHRYCTQWLVEIVQDTPEIAAGVSAKDKESVIEDGPVQQRIHSQQVRNLAAIILAKIQAVSSVFNTASDNSNQPTMSIDDLSTMFMSLIVTDGLQQSSIEGLAYASLRAEVKEKLSSDIKFLANLTIALKEAPATSSTTYGALTILFNLTNYTPAVSEEQKRMAQLKAYASATKPTSAITSLDDNEHVTRRCLSVFDAGFIPILVTHSRYGSSASLILVVSIIFSLSKTPSIRGAMAQQGSIKLLLHAYAHLPSTSVLALRTTAHALARILISTNPLHVFGGSTPLSLTSAIRPLTTLLNHPDPEGPLDLLPVFESLLALTNLASVDDDSLARNPIIRSLSLSEIEELLLSSNKMISRASTELLCNLVQSPSAAEKCADDTKAASQRMHILLALADAEDLQTRKAAGGAIAGLTEWSGAVKALLERGQSSAAILLDLCKEEEEDLRQRGVVCVWNLVNAEAALGKWGRKEIRSAGGVKALKECLKMSRSQEVLGTAVASLKLLLQDDPEMGEEERKADDALGNGGNGIERRGPGHS